MRRWGRGVQNGYLSLVESGGGGDARFLASDLLAAPVASVVIGLPWGVLTAARTRFPRSVGRALCALSAVAASLFVARRIGTPSKADDPAGVWAASKARVSNEARMGRLLDGMTQTLGLEGKSARPMDVRRALMERAVDGARADFGLSDREAEALSLHALGLTQGKIADELGVSSSAVHSHIAHICSKADNHWRQELMDCLDGQIDVESGPRQGSRGR